MVQVGEAPDVFDSFGRVEVSFQLDAVQLDVVQVSEEPTLSGMQQFWTNKKSLRDHHALRV